MFRSRRSTQPCGADKMTCSWTRSTQPCGADTMTCCWTRSDGLFQVRPNLSEKPSITPIVFFSFALLLQYLILKTFSGGQGTFTTVKLFTRHLYSLWSGYTVKQNDHHPLGFIYRLLKLKLEMTKAIYTFERISHLMDNFISTF